MVHKSSGLASSGSGGGITSINSDTTAAQIIAAGSGISVGTSAGTTTIAAVGGGSGTVTSVSGITANGFAFSVANATTTPAITAKTTITGVLQGNGTAISGISTGIAGRLLFDQGSANAAFEVVNGDVSAISTGAFTLNAIQGTIITGVSGTSNVVLSNQPTLTSANFTGVTSVTTTGNVSVGGNIGIAGAINSGSWQGNVIGAQYGGTGQNNSSATGVAQWSNGVYSVSTGLFNGTTAITQTAGDNSTKIATDAFVTTAVNNAISGVNPAVAVQYATTAAGDTSALTYSNGVSGVGATLTGVNNATTSMDGHTFVVGDVGVTRVLVKNDTQSPSGAFNGIYLFTALHTVGTGDIFTRALDYDMPSDINNTGAIPVINGTVNAQTTWVETATVNTVGTDPLSFTKFSLNPTTIITTSTTAGGGLTGTYPNPALANPSATSLGGVNSISAITHNFLISLSTGGAFALSQPAFTDLTGTATTAQLPVNQTLREVVFSLDGQGSAIVSGGTWYLANTNFAGTITSWSLVADRSGSIDIDVWKANAAVPTVSNTITASAQCSLASTQSVFNGPITGWSSAISKGDCWGFNIVSASTVQKANLTINITAL